MSDTPKTVCKAHEIETGKAKIIHIDDQSIAVFRLGDKEFSAIDNTCPHAGGSLGEGYLDGAIVTCPWHGWQFNVKTGACETVPQDRIRHYKAKRDGDDILVQLS